MSFIVHHGKCLDVLRLMSSASVDCVVTDPPYGTGAWKRGVEGAGSDCKAEHQVEEWDVWDPAWILEAERISRGPVLTFCPQPRIPELWMPERCRLLLWCKSDARPRFSGQQAYAFEPIVARGALQPIGGPDYMIDSAPRLRRDSDATGHPHQKPIDVMRWLVRLACPPGGSVLDMHCGSGTTGVAAVVEGRSFIGVEQSAEWAEKSRHRIAAADPIGRQETIGGVA